jgi:hypothetical protein
MVKHFKHLCFNLAFWGLCFLALFAHVDGALNVVYVLVGITFFGSLVMLSEPGQEALIKSGPRTFLGRPCSYVDLALGLTMIWFSHWFVGIFFLLAIGMTEAAWIEAKEASDSVKEENV